MEEYRELINVIKNALCSIDASYFLIRTTYKPSGIVRERVFCYELYHQIRQATLANLTLHGEIDKNGHCDFQTQHRHNPDFVFHTPGMQEDNTIVVEVKGKLKESRRAILHDFNKLLTFVSNYHYKVGVFILYNHGLGELVELLGDDLRELQQHDAANRICILAIPSPLAGCREGVLSALKV